MDVPIMSVCAFRHACDRSAYVHFCTCLCLCVFLDCLGGWALLLWQLSAAEGLERWQPLKWSWSICEYTCAFVFCGFISNESDEICVCCEFERELDQIIENLGTRLTPVPTRWEVNERQEKRELHLKKQQWRLDEAMLLSSGWYRSWRCCSTCLTCVSHMNLTVSSNIRSPDRNRDFYSSHAYVFCSP